MASEKRVVMKHSLAKALMDAGMEHFDQGGTQQMLLPGVNTNVSSPGDFITKNSDPRNSGIVQGVQNIGSAATDVSNGLGSFFQGAGNALTAKNNYQASLAPTDYTNYGNLISTASGQALNGYGNANDVYNRQANLATALLNQSQGAGPNPAQAMFNNATGQNVSNTAALIASARGANANPGMAATNAARIGANVQQQAVGQGAANLAAQELGQESEAANVLNEAGATNLGEQNVNNTLFGTAAGAQNTQNANEISNYGMSQGINSQVAQNNANAVNKSTSNIIGGITGGAGSALSSIFAEGGEVKSDGGDDVGDVAKVSIPNEISTDTGGQGFGSSSDSSGQKKGGGIGGLVALLSQGGQPTDYRSGGPVPGKASVKGNSPKNDTVPALLSPGEEVLPRTVTQAPDAPERAKAFVQALQDKKEKDAGAGFGKVVKARATLKDRVAHLEKLCCGGMP